MSKTAAEGPVESRRRALLGLFSLPIAMLQTTGASATGDVPVARLSDLAQPWSAVKFTLPDPEGGETPCIIVRLPGDKWYASSLVCPHNKCTAMYVTDLDMVRDSFNVDTKTPVIACPCHFSVFDLTHGGQVIGGPAPNPPMQLNIRIQGNDVFVSR